MPKADMPQQVVFYSSRTQCIRKNKRLIAKKPAAMSLAGAMSV
jgi:hypothetical protein